MIRIRHREGYEILHDAILPEHVDDLAKRLGKHPDTVQRWRRKPESTEDPTDSGRRSPYDTFLDLVVGNYIDNPDGSREMVDGAKNRLAELERIHGAGQFNERATVAEMMEHMSDTAGELLDGELTQNALRQMRRFHRFLGQRIDEAAAALEQREGGRRKR
jgi:hypothetical protein